MLAPLLLAAVVFTQCTETVKQKYKEWRNLNSVEQQQYLAAINCHRMLDARIKTNPELTSVQHTSRMDDFVYAYYFVHDPMVYCKPSILPFHRAMLRIYDQQLTECNYNGPIPYWDWTLDAKDPSQSPVWQAFGGVGPNPIWGGNWKTSYPKRHSVIREYNNLKGAIFTPEVVDGYVKGFVGDYDEFRKVMDTVLLKIREIMGGESDMELVVNAPADPLFYLIIRNMDRLWALWQANDPKNKNEYRGYHAVRTREQYRYATLEDTLGFFGLHANVQVKEVMSTTSGLMGNLMCYEYLNPVPVVSQTKGPVAPQTNAHHGRVVLQHQGPVQQHQVVPPTNPHQGQGVPKTTIQQRLWAIGNTDVVQWWNRKFGRQQ